MTRAPGFRPATLSILLAATLAHSQSTPPSNLQTLSDEEATQLTSAIEARTPIVTLDGLETKLWASEALLIDPVGLDIDDKGRAWVSVTRRRRSSMFDIRSFPQWVAESWSWKTVEERIEFLHRELAPENSDQNSWLADFNEDGSHDWKDLRFEQDEIYLLQDTTGNGLANESRHLAWFPSQEQTDIAGTVLYHNNALYVGLPPDLWKIYDSDGDGAFDKKESISSGYGVHIGIGGHGLSGLKVGLDGRLYWGIGDVGYTGTDRDGDYHEYPRQGIVVRSEPDGTGFEVFAHGLRNMHEFDWDAFGNLIGVDNDGDHPGEDERLVYIIDGSDSGWRNNWQLGKYTDPKNNAYKVWMDERYYKPRFDDQAAHILPPLENYHTGPAGLVYQPGAALGGLLQDHFFVASFTGNAANSSVYAYALEAKGAAFSLKDDVKVMSGVTAVGIDFGPEGALYLSDWAEGWDTDGIGRIWKLDTSALPSELTTETESILKSPSGKISRSELMTLLNHADRRVRMKAQFELVKREEERALKMALSFPDDFRMARLHAIWGLGQLFRSGIASPEELAPYTKHHDPEVRAQIARVWGDVRYAPAREQLEEWAINEQPRIQLLATEALGRIGDSLSFEPIVSMLENNDDQEVYLRQAGVIALSRIDDGSRIAALSDHPSRAVRIAAIVALKRLDHPAAARFLDDPDPFVVANAARAINDDAFITEAIPALAALLDGNQSDYQPLVRRVINANLYSGKTADASRLATYAASLDHPAILRIEAIDTLATWADPSIYDRVTGRIRTIPQNDIADAQSALAAVYPQLLESENGEIQVAAIEAIGSLQLVSADRALLEIVGNAEPDPSQIAALESLRMLSSENLITAIEMALSTGTPKVRAKALSLVPQLESNNEEKASLLIAAWDNATTTQRQTILTTLADLPSETTLSFIKERLDELQNGSFDETLQLELIAAIEKSAAPSLVEEIASFQAQQQSLGGLAPYRYALHGGDSQSGRDVVYNVPAAQCIRCHAIGGQGGDVGPDLAAVGARLERETLLESLIDPSAKIADGYGIVSLTTNDGETVQGILVSDNGYETVVKISDGTETRIQNSDIAQRTTAPSSMPPMGLLLNREQLRDVVAYLASLKGEGPSQQKDSLSHGN